MNKPSTTLYKLAVLCCFFSLVTGISATRGATTTYNDVYQVTDLGNRGLDVILRKTKGVKQPVLPLWTEKNLNAFHVYQIQIACLDEIRRMQAKFKMTPYPHIIVSPGPLSEKNLYKLSTILLSEIRRIAIHLNIWGLPKQKRTFSEKKSNAIYKETLALYLKLRVLGGKKLPTSPEIAGELGRAIADIKNLLNHIDPAKRYRDVFPPLPQQDVGTSYSALLAVRHELNTMRNFYRLPQIRLPKTNKTPTPTDLFTQSQIIIGELNQLKTTAKTQQPAPPVSEATTHSIAQQINTLHKLISQIKPLTRLNQQGGE